MTHNGGAGAISSGPSMRDSYSSASASYSEHSKDDGHNHSSDYSSSRPDSYQ